MIETSRIEKSIALRALFDALIDIGSRLRGALDPYERQSVNEMLDLVDKLCRRDLDQALVDIKNDSDSEIAEKLYAAALRPCDSLKN